LIIDARDKEGLGLFCHIVDKKTGQDLTKKHPFHWWDTDKKKGEYILQDMDGRPVWYSDTEEIEVIRARFPNAKTVIECTINDREYIWYHLPEDFRDHDIEIKLID
jgi:hypothetical protein